MARTIQAFLSDQSAATAIEYGLIAGLIAVALIGSLTIFGDVLVNLMGAGTGTSAALIDNRAAQIR